MRWESGGEARRAGVIALSVRGTRRGKGSIIQECDAGIRILGWSQS